MYASAPPKPAMIRFSIAASSILPLVAQVFIAPTSSITRPVAIAAAIRPSNGSSMIAKGMTLAWQTRYVRTTCNVRTIQAVGCLVRCGGLLAWPVRYAWDRSWMHYALRHCGKIAAYRIQADLLASPRAQGGPPVLCYVAS